VTERYQDVRFGEQEITVDEARELDDLIDQMAKV